MDNNMEKAVVITGGSGFIGSNVCKLFVESGFNVINIDRKKREIPGVTQYPFEIDNKQVKGIIELIKPYAVIHIAADNSVPKSVLDPMPTYTDNVYQTISLLNTCVGAKVPNFIYASSSSVYGTSINEDGSFKETDPCGPVNPYGRTKQMAENIIKDYAEVYGFNYANLRLFNVAGSNNGKYGYQKDPLVHVLPILTQAGLNGDEFVINGDDYNTPDGTCVRDYTHVNDVARAFLSTAYYMFDQHENITVNIGNSNPISMKELIGAVGDEIGTPIETSMGTSRAGDMIQTHADITLAQDLLGWEPTNSIHQIILDEIKWQKTKIKKR
jgi:UDP-arabinose 4-epimerase|tara:strand:+ start:5444 stop:6424 length:981 start_codon:yes stop_codon:yes gene_type:complete